MADLKVGSKAIIINAKHHPQENCKMCEILEIDVKKQLVFVQIKKTNLLSTMWVSFNELIPILYEKKEDIEKYRNLEHLYGLFAEYKGYYDFICEIANDECNRSEKLTKENQNLQCKIDEMQKHIDCMKSQIGELRTRCHESARDNFDNKHYGLIHIVGAEELKEDKPVFPDEPIKVAEMLICASGHFSNLFGKQQEYNIFSKSELRQIAEHLLVYCNAEE